MNGQQAFALASAQSLASVGFKVNRNGGSFQKGKAYGADTKLMVSATLQRLSGERGSPPSDSEVARVTKVGRTFVRKVREELLDHGRVLHPDETIPRRDRGVGIISLTEEEEACLLHLRFEDPRRSNRSYVDNLFLRTGKVISESLVSSWFDTRFDFGGKMKVPSMVPLDKFKEENILRYVEYLQFVSTIQNPRRFKFGGMKHLNGADLSHRKARANPMTGDMEGLIVDGDFRKRYDINAIMSLNPLKPPLFISIAEDTNDAAACLAFVELALEADYFDRDDIFVLDNWTGHRNGEAEILEDLLWNYTGKDGLPMHILAVFLPTHSPELNPIKLIFQILVQRMKTERLLGFRADSDAAALYARKVFGEMTHVDTIKCTMHCYPNM